jgi:hypothetical protein
MNDEERRREMYEAAGSGAAEWGKPTRPESGRRHRLESIISVRFSPDEIDRIRAAAQENEVTVSAYIRAAALSKYDLDRPRQLLLFPGGSQPHRGATELLTITFVQPTTTSNETGGGVGVTMTATG